MNNVVSVNLGHDFASHWMEHKAELRNFIYKRVKDFYQTNDILQDVFMKLYIAGTAGTEVRNFRGWLFQMALNAIVDIYRKSKNHVSLDSPTSSCCSSGHKKTIKSAKEMYCSS
jgi:RNA polymerase sigma-70 factor, ECF subfamily